MRKDQCPTCNIAQNRPTNQRLCYACTDERERDRIAVLEERLPKVEFRRRWRVPRRPEEQVYRPHLEGAMDVSGDTFQLFNKTYLTPRGIAKVQAVAVT